MAAPVVLEPEPEPADVGPGSEPVQAEGDTVAVPEFRPADAVMLTEPEPAQTEATGAEPEAAPLAPVLAANDATPEPAIKPILIGGEQDVVVERKRGWWRR